MNMYKNIGMFLLSLLLIGCNTPKRADTIDSFLNSCITLLETQVSADDYIKFCVLPENLAKIKATKKEKYNKVLKEFSANKREYINQTKALKKRKPYKFKYNEYAYYKISGNQTVKLIYLGGRWYFEK